MRKPSLYTYALSLLLLLSFKAYSQRPTLNEIATLFNKTPSPISVKTFLLSKGFTYQGKDDEFYNYELPEYGNVCDIQIGYQKGRLNVFSTQQSIMYFQQYLSILYQNGFILGKHFPPENVVDGRPIPQDGASFQFTNKALHLSCVMIFPVENNNGFLLNYCRYP